MPSTHVSLHYHLVFSTKDREPLITTEVRERVHAYLEQHHRKRSFQDEYREFLAKHEIEFDERYLW